MTLTARQRDLFTKRVRTPKAEPEFKLHVAVAKLLKVSLSPGWTWWHTPNGEYRTAATGGRLKAMGVKQGVSDIILVGPPGGRVHALELKRRGEHPTGPQTAFLALVRLAGGQSDCADNLDDVISILKGWGAVRVTL